MRFNDVQNTAKLRKPSAKKHHKLTKEQVQKNFETMIARTHNEKPFMFFGVKFSM